MVSRSGVAAVGGSLHPFPGRKRRRRVKRQAIPTKRARKETAGLAVWPAGRGGVRRDCHRALAAEAHDHVFDAGMISSGVPIRLFASPSSGDQLLMRRFALRRALRTGRIVSTGRCRFRRDADAAQDICGGGHEPLPSPIPARYASIQRVPEAVSPKNRVGWGCIVFGRIVFANAKWHKRKPLLKISRLLGSRVFPHLGTQAKNRW
jgi:hypothetical protein